jgi:predicted transcriptional regulator
MPQPVESDGVLGLDPAERDAYELIMSRPSATLAELAESWRRTEPLADVLAALEDRSLIVSTVDRFRAVAPALAFDALLTDFEDQLEHARRHAGTLDAAYQARPTTRATSTVVEVVTGQRAVHQRLWQIKRAAREQIGFLAKPPRFVDETDTGPLSRGVACRTIYDRSSIEPPGALSTVEHLINRGQLARVLPDLPVSLYLADERIAVLPLQRQPAAADAIVVVHPSALLDALVKLFETLWQRALPLHAPPADQEGEAQRLITLLLSGLTDEAIAHQLGLSHRTVQRRVAKLMAELGAHTRFQAGVQAALGQLR